MPDIIAAIDNGTSSSKTLWQRSTDDTARLMLMGAELLEVSANDLLDSGLSGGKPENNAWIHFPDGHLWVLGLKAQEMRGRPPLQLSKYAPSVYKICALVGAIAQTAQLPSQFSVSLAALLPYAEYQDRRRFVDLLTTALGQFEFRGTPYQVTVESLDVRPEGAGLAQTHRSTVPTAFDRQNTLVMMIGQRDLSLLPFQQGTPQQGTSEHLGFAEFQREVVVRAALNLGVKDMARLPEYLFRSRHEPEFLDRIALMVVDEMELSHKAAQIQTAIDQAQARYLGGLFTWLKTTLGQDLYEFQEVVISGGGAIYFRPELEAFFAHYRNLKLFWDEDIQDQVSQSLGYAIEPNLGFRLFDVYGVFRVLANKVQKQWLAAKEATAIAAPVAVPQPEPAPSVPAPESIVTLSESPLPEMVSQTVSHEAPEPPQLSDDRDVTRPPAEEAVEMATIAAKTELEAEPEAVVELMPEPVVESPPLLAQPETAIQSTLKTSTSRKTSKSSARGGSKL